MDASQYLCKAIPSTEMGLSRGTLWNLRLELLCSTVALTREEAKAHVMVQQRKACCVREAKRGPRGRGAMQYNFGTSWPEFWTPNRHHRYFAVIELVLAEPVSREEEKAIRLALAYGSSTQQLMSRK
jgi:hypothetical protein